MAYLNKVMLIGNIGKDPEVRVTPTGRKKISFSLATSRRYRDASGETHEMTDWHNIVGWGKIADLIESLGVRKGMSLYVEGAITYRSWDDQTTGQKRYVTDINMDTFQLLTPRSQNQGGSSYASGNASQPTSYGNNRPAYENNPQAPGYDNQSSSAAGDDDLPF